MKVAVTAQGRDLTSPIDPLFGRAKYLVVVDTESSDFTVHDNTANIRAPHGSGTRTARAVVELGSDAVITGNAGHKAFGTLQANNVKAYQESSGTVQEAIGELTKGRLEAMSRATVPGHWQEVS